MVKPAVRIALSELRFPCAARGVGVRGKVDARLRGIAG